jgi:hypothetical protein
MSNRGHNKKRNTGLLYEFLVSDISRALVDNNQRRSSLSLKLLKRHFKKDSALYKEFRLINALVKTTVSSEAVAASIVQEAKKSARSYDVDALDREKSILIRNINHKINDDVFYDQSVNEYRMYATIQTLLNDWRSPEADIERLAKYEDQLMKHLTTEKTKNAEHFINEESSGTSRLLMKVMMKKLNEKYSGILNEAQKSIVRSYVWSTTQDDPLAIKRKLSEVKDNLLASIESFSMNDANEYITNKLTAVKEQLVSESLNHVDDDTVTRFMLYIKLNNELTESSND